MISGPRYQPLKELRRGVIKDGGQVDKYLWSGYIFLLKASACRRGIRSFGLGNFGEKVFPQKSPISPTILFVSMIRYYGMFSHNKLEKLVLNVFENFGDFGEKLTGGYPPPQFGGNY